MGVPYGSVVWHRGERDIDVYHGGEDEPDQPAYVVLEEGDFVEVTRREVECNPVFSPYNAGRLAWYRIRNSGGRLVEEFVHATEWKPTRDPA